MSGSTVVTDPPDRDPTEDDGTDGHGATTTVATGAAPTVGSAAAPTVAPAEVEPAAPPGPADDDPHPEGRADATPDPLPGPGGDDGSPIEPVDADDEASYPAPSAVPSAATPSCWPSPC